MTRDDEGRCADPTPLWDFTVARIPMLTIAILYMTFFSYKLMPAHPNEQFRDVAGGTSEENRLSPFKRKLAVVIVLATILLMLLENVIGIKMYLTSCIGAAALVLTGVLSEKKHSTPSTSPRSFCLPVCWRCPMQSRPRVRAMWWRTG